jgi:drug/metabolite transporter (DMT)-like permease
VDAVKESNVDRQTSSEAGPPRSVARLVLYCAILAAVIVPVAAAMGWYGHWRFQQMGILAAVVAALVCWGASAAALVATYLGQQLQAPVQGILIGMFFRMGVPLVAGLVLHEQGGPLAQAGVFAMIVGLYFCSLIVETLLSLRLVPQSNVQLGKAA